REIAELHGAIFVGLTKWCGPRIMQSLVMLIAARHSSPTLTRGGLRASACTGRVWSGSGRITTQATQATQASTRYRFAGCAGRGRGRGRPMGEAPNKSTKPSKPNKEDSTRKQSIPHRKGAPDS